MPDAYVYLFCEGGSGSLDMQMLRKIPFDGKTVTLQPYGGKGGYGRFVKGFEEGVGMYLKSLGTVPSSHFVVLRDRDFDFGVPDTPQLIKAGQNVFATYRTTVENYLLHPETLFHYAAEGQHRGLFSEPNDAQTLFEEAAMRILPFQAARHALGKIRSKAEQKTNFIRPTDALHSTSERFFDSGELPVNCDNKDFCIEEAHRVIAHFQQEAGKFSHDNFDEAFTHFFMQFSQPAFFDGLTYLAFFQGKDLAKALTALLPSDFSIKRYYNYALEHFDYKQCADLQNLRDYIQRL